MSTSYKRYAVIYKTSIVDAVEPLVNDPVRFEIFTGSRKYAIPAQTSRVVVADTGGLIGAKAELILNDNQTYIEIVARTKERDLLVAQAFCEAEVNRYISMLSAAYSADMFDQPIYAGWILNDKQALISVWLKRTHRLVINNDELTDLHKKLKSLEVSDPELLRRFLLMAKFFARSVTYDPGEEKFLFLWTILEIYPMRGTPKGKTNIKSVSQYIAPILGHSSDDIMQKLELGNMYGLRSGLVHAGQLGIPLNELGNFIGKLESIVRTVLREIAGLQYQGDLDEYFI